MGTHHKGPSVIKSTGETLAQWIGKHPESLGDREKPVLNGSVDQLPFLFKVLSVNVALSIQVHPDKVF
jgi:mannose-6-phosphate isomerase